MTNEDREITQEELDLAAAQEQGVADDAMAQHLSQRVSVLRAALNSVQEENKALKAQIEALQSPQSPQNETVPGEVVA